MKYLLALVVCLSLAPGVRAETYYFIGTTLPNILEENQDGQVVGLGAELARTIAGNLGHQITIELFPFKRALYMMESGEADAFIGPYRSQRRERYMKFTRSWFYQDAMTFYTREESPFQWDGRPSSLESQGVGTIRGWSYGPEFDRARKDLNIYEAANVVTAFRMLMRGRVDLVAAHPRAARRAMTELDIRDRITSVEPVISVNKGYFGFSRKRDIDAFFDQFDLALTSMVESGEVSRLSRSYGIESVNR